MNNGDGAEFDINNIIKGIGQQDVISSSWLQEWMQPFIYLLYEDNEVIYIGQSKHGISRIIYHMKDGGKQFTHFKIINCKPQQLDDIEADLIVYFLPKYNGIIPKNSKWVCHNYLKEETKSLIIKEKSRIPHTCLVKKILKANQWIDNIHLNGIRYCSKSKYIHTLTTIVKRGDKNNLKVDPMGVNFSGF